MRRIILYLNIVGLVFFLAGCSKENGNNNIHDVFYLRNEGADMPVYVEGNNLNNIFVIMLPGGPGGDSHTYNTGISYFSDQLEEKFVMVYYDQRGSGTSMGNYSIKDLTVEQYMKDLDLLIILLQELYGNDISIFLMGHSWGGTLGTAYLIDMNSDNRIRGWIEIDGAHNFKTDINNIKQLKEIGNEQIGAGNSDDFWQEIIDYCDEIDTNNISNEEISKLNSYAYEAENQLIKDGIIVFSSKKITLQNYFGGLINHYFFSAYNPLTAWTNSKITGSGLGMFSEVITIDYTDKLDRITIPTLILWGKYDLVIPLSSGEEAYEKIGAAEKEMIVFENSGHSPMLTEPDKVASKIISFIYRYR